MNFKNVVLFFLIISVQAFAQVVKFEKVFGGNGYDYGNDVIQTYDKGYVVAGTTTSFGSGSTDSYLLKTDSLGIFQWHKTFGGINIDQFYSIQETVDSGLIMAGYTNNFGSGGYDMYVVKTDRLGNVEWSKTYGGSNWDFAYSINKTNDGGYVITGGTYSYGNGDEDVYLVRINNIGDTLWTKTYGGSLQDEAKKVVQSSDNGFILTGFTKSFGDTDGDIYTIKTDANGDTLWTFIYHGAMPDFSTDVIENNTGNFILAGQTKSFGLGGFDGYKIILSPSGVVISTNYYGGASGDENFYSIHESVGGRYAMLGYTNSFGAGDKDLLLYIENPYNGFHSATIGGANKDMGYALRETKDKGYIICGVTMSFSILDHIYIIKTDSNGVASGFTNVIDTGIDDVSFKSDLDIFPNPADDRFFLDLTNYDEKKVRVSIYDLFGRLVFFSGDIKEKTYTVNTTEYRNGVYYVSVVDSEKSTTKKIIIRH